MKLKDLIEQYGEYEVVLSKREATSEIMIEGRKPKPKTVWDLEKGDKYYCVDYDGDIYPHTDVHSFYDQCIIENGNAFLTKEEADRWMNSKPVGKEEI